MYRAITITAAVAAILGCSGLGPAPADEAVITGAALGSLKNEGGVVRLDQPTTRLPLVPGRSGDMDTEFGICFQHRSATPISNLEVLVQPPGVVEIDNSGNNIQQTQDGLRVQVETLQAGEGEFCQGMFFSEGDPAGTWVFHLLQGGTVHGSWSIEVYAVESSRPTDRPRRGKRGKQGR